MPITAPAFLLLPCPSRPLLTLPLTLPLTLFLTLPLTLSIGAA